MIVSSERTKIGSRVCWPAGTIAAATIVLIAIFASFARSETTRTVRIVVPIAPGGFADTLARMVAEATSRAEGLTVMVEDRPGAGTALGTEAVARAAPDGNTLLLTAPAFVINPLLRKLNYDPLTSFEPVCYLARAPMVIAVNSASSFHTLADLIDAARAHPSGLTLAGSSGSLFQIVFERLKRAANVDMTFVPYPGNIPAVTALLGGHVTSILVSYSDAAAQMEAGKLRALATASAERLELAPQLPTFAEAGYPSIDAEGWFGLVAPAKTPTPVVSQLAGWFSEALRTPTIKAKLLEQGNLAVGMCGAPFAAFLHKQYDDYGVVIRESKMQAE